MAFSGNDTKVEASIVTAQHRISIVAEGSHDDAVLVYGPTSGGEFRPYIKVRLFGLDFWEKGLSTVNTNNLSPDDKI